MHSVTIQHSRSIVHAIRLPRPIFDRAAQRWVRFAWSSSFVQGAEQERDYSILIVAECA
jgi:hypothetical protein